MYERGPHLSGWENAGFTAIIAATFCAPFVAMINLEDSGLPSAVLVLLAASTVAPTFAITITVFHQISKYAQPTRDRPLGLTWPAVFELQAVAYFLAPAVKQDELGRAEVALFIVFAVVALLFGRRLRTAAAAKARPR